AEYGVIRTYLEWLVDLPWSKETEDNLDIAHAREVLDEDHYDLERVKDGSLEYLAVRKLNPESPGPILCFVGPPGVGKTSLGRSIAKALGREFERISVGGVRDEAEIRGHRRTYIGAMPGTIVRALRDAGSLNPVFMIDEIDKMGADFRGDPASAMLEVLDPAQNDSFRDHYLDLEFDLSDVVFIATANVLDTVPSPLLDRMETIELAGYTLEEKRQIARRYLVGRQIAARLGENWFAEHDIHIHVPAGAVPKDGPSAGVAMTVALASLISGRPVRNDVAMTGEVTLTGQVLPIGGLKEKSLAAQRAGIKRVIVPERNRGDLAEIPEHERAGLEFTFVDRVDAVLEAALS